MRIKSVVFVYSLLLSLLSCSRNPMLKYVRRCRVVEMYSTGESCMAFMQAGRRSPRRLMLQYVLALLSADSLSTDMRGLIASETCTLNF